MSVASITPFDAPNRQQIAQGHPPDWRPPRPKDGYDLVVLGGGPAGLTAAVAAATAGHAVAMVERNLTGGTCVSPACLCAEVARVEPAVGSFQGVGHLAGWPHPPGRWPGYSAGRGAPWAGGG